MFLSFPFLIIWPWCGRFPTAEQNQVRTAWCSGHLYGFPRRFPFFALHDFQTQSATMIEFRRAPGAMWLPWGRLDWKFGETWGKVLICPDAGWQEFTFTVLEETAIQQGGQNRIDGLLVLHHLSRVLLRPIDCRTKPQFFASELCNPWQFQHIVTDFLRTVVLGDLGIQRSRWCFGLSEIVSRKKSWGSLCDCLLPREQNAAGDPRWVAGTWETSPVPRLFQTKKDTGLSPI